MSDVTPVTHDESGAACAAQVANDRRRMIDEAARLAAWSGRVSEQAEMLAQGQLRAEIAERAQRAAEAVAPRDAVEVARLVAVLEQMPVGVALAELPSGRLLSHNAEAERLLRHPMPVCDDYTGYAQYGALHPGDRPYAADEYPIARAVLRGETVVGEEMLYRRGDGTLTYFWVTAAPIRDRRGEPILAICTFEDIGARKRAERQREEFLRLATHDLRQPLSTLRGRAQLVRRGAERGTIDANWLGEHMDAVWEATDQMLAIINELGDVARLQAGEALELHREPVDVAMLARAVADEVSQQRPAAQVRVAAPEAPVMVSGDRARLRRVLQNIIGNALKYSPDDAPVHAHVEITTEHAAVIAVRDRGVGIPAEDLPHLFTPYYRASNAQGVAGTGLGLAGAKAIVEQHGGSITIESVVGQGTTVTLTLPVIEGELEQDA